MSSVPVRILSGWSRSFERKRWGWFVLVVILSNASLHWGHFLLWPVVLYVGLWPFPYRARWTESGLDVRWLFVRECLSLADIRGAQLRTDLRRWRVLRVGLALDIELSEGRHAIVVAPRTILEDLSSRITAALALSAAPPPSRHGFMQSV